MPDHLPSPEFYALASAWAGAHNPEAIASGRWRLVVEVPGPGGWLAVMEVVKTVGAAAVTQTTLSDKAQEAIAFLRRQPEGAIMKRRTLAAELELEADGGHFNSVIAELKAATMIDVQRGPHGGIRVLTTVSV